jgi:hypothetical protein
VRLVAYDDHGRRLSPTATLARMGNGDADRRGDALIEPGSLEVLAEHPLRVAGGALRLSLPRRPAALAINWPTARGYSLLVLDGGGRGLAAGTTVNLTHRAALDARRRLDDGLAARPGYRPSPAFRAAYARARGHLAAAAAARGAAARGREGARALDDLAAAYDLMLAEDGVARAACRTGRDAPWLGVTLDTDEAGTARLDLAARLLGPGGWVRLVFDPGRPPADYAALLGAARARGLRVLGQPVDSDEAARYSRAEYLERVRAYVDAFPEVEAWEVGNEVNGSWLGTGMAEKVADAAAYVRATRPRASVVLTLYWQLGTDEARWSTLNWARANLAPSTRANLDVVMLSTWLDDAPLGLGLDSVMRALAAEFPDQRIGLGELGYRGPDTSRAWWAFDRRHPAAARRAVAAQYYRAALSHPASVGGGFWWYFAEDMPHDAGLRAALADVARDLRARRCG